MEPFTFDLSSERYRAGKRTGLMRLKIAVCIVNDQRRKLKVEMAQATEAMDS